LLTVDSRPLTYLTVQVTSSLVYEFVIHAWSRDGVGAVFELRAVTRDEFERWMAAFIEIGWLRTPLPGYAALTAQPRHRQQPSTDAPRRIVQVSFLLPLYCTRIMLTV